MKTFFFFFFFFFLVWTTKIAAPSNCWARFCSSNNSAREELGLPTCGPSAEIIAHPCSKLCARAHGFQRLRTRVNYCAQTYNEAMFSAGKLRKIVLGPAKRTHFIAKCSVQWRRAIGLLFTNFLRCATFYNLKN